MKIDANSLEPGERLLWYGEPNAPEFSEPNYGRTRALGVGLLVLAVAIWAIQFVNDVASEGVHTPAVGLLLFGALLACRPFWVRRGLRRARYALTDRRAIIEQPGLLPRNRDSIPYAQAGLIEIRNGEFKFGDVIVRDCYCQTEDGLQNSRGGFLAIQDFVKVAQLLRSQVEAARETSLLQVRPGTWSIPSGGRASAASGNQ